MKKINHLVLFVLALMLLFLMSCSAEKEQEETVVHFKSSIIGSQAGGVIIGGYSNDAKSFIRFSPVQNGEVWNLPNGNWSFAAIGWTGTGLMKGQVRCSGVVNKNLIGGIDNVALAIKNSNCGAPFYNSTPGDPHYDSGIFNPLKVVTCKEKPTGSESAEGNCDGSSNIGKYKSFKLFMPITTEVVSFAERASWDGEHEGPWWPPQISRSFSGECYNFLPNTSSAATTYNVPVNNGKDILFAMNPLVITYESPNCPETDFQNENMSVFSFFTGEDSSYVITGSSQTTVYVADEQNNAYDCATFSNYTSITGSIIDCHTPTMIPIPLVSYDLSPSAYIIMKTSAGNFAKIEVTAATLLSNSVTFNYKVYSSSDYSEIYSKNGFTLTYGSPEYVDIDTNTPSAQGTDDGNVDLGITYWGVAFLFSGDLGGSKFKRVLGYQNGAAEKLRILISPFTRYKYLYDDPTYSPSSCVPLRVASVDTYGRFANLGTGITVELYSYPNAGGGTGTFYSDSSCGTPLTGTPQVTTISTGDSSTSTFYYQHSGYSGTTDVLFKVADASGTVIESAIQVGRWNP